MKLFTIFLYSSLFFSDFAWGAACCGGGSSVPSLITGDDQHIFSSSLSTSEIRTDVAPDGTWSNRSTPDTRQTLKLEGAHLLSDRLQAGYSVPMQTRKNTSNVGDITLQVGYEYLPDWNYHPWRPKGVGFLFVTTPSGKSIYDSDLIDGQEITGRGFWAVGLGSTLLKAWRRWDAITTFEMHKAFEREYENQKVKPGYGGALSLGAGYNIEKFRIGGNLSWSYEDAIVVEGYGPGSSQRFATASVSISHMFKDLWSTTVTYSDQSLIGEPVNTSLSKSVAMLIQRRWPR